MIAVPDSFSKIVTAYFAALTKEPFTYKNQLFEPKPILISPLLFRGFTCPSHCGGCCHSVTLDWLPTEPQPEDLLPRTVEFNGRAYLLMTDPQDHERTKCKHLRIDDGRCSIHGLHPMPCDVELTKFIHYEHKSLLIQKKYGRGWAFSRVDGGRGSLCEMTPITDQTRADVVRKLRRIRDWVNYFGLDAWINEIITWSEEYPTFEPLRLEIRKETSLRPKEIT